LNTSVSTLKISLDQSIGQRFISLRALKVQASKHGFQGRLRDPSALHQDGESFTTHNP